MLRKFGIDIIKYHPLYDNLLYKYNFETIIDIGANDGQFAEEIHQKLPGAAIYSFEPIESVYKKLMVNMRNVSNFKAFNVGLGEKSEKTTINKSSFSPSSSLLRMATLHKKLYPKSAEIIEETAQIETLDNFLEQIDFRGNLLIKIDVQGYEDKVIKGGKKTFERARMLIVETSFVRLYEGQPLFEDVVLLLRDLGFSYCGSREQHWNKLTDELIYQDSIFRRNG